MFSKIVKFVRESKAEMLKVDWPDKKQVTNYTIIILAIGLVMMVFLGGLDFVFGEILKSIVAKRNI